MICTCSQEHQNNNTGCNNSGYYNSGDGNSGDYDSGKYNSGDYDSGYGNSGDYDSGDYNSGDGNSGNYNSGKYNSGWFNTNEPKMRFFNQDSGLTYSEFSKNLDRMVYPNLKVCAWVSLEDLPENEKDENATQRGGTLKTLSYKEAWAEYWSRSSQEDKKWFMDLPNFDPEIFKEITGIQVVDKEKSLGGKTVKIEIDGQNYEAIIK